MKSDLSLTARSLAAAKWSYLGNGVRVFFQFFIGLVLARLLGPEAFGVVAIALLMVVFGKLVSDFGISAALIQRTDITEQDIGFAFTVQVFIGAFLSISGILAAEHIADFFQYPSATQVIQAMAALFLIQAIGQTTTAVLNRSLKFKLVQSLIIYSYLIAYVLIGIPLAYLGFGAWSLVAAQLVQAIAYTSALFIFAGARIRPALRPTNSGLLKFGSKVTGANLTSWCVSNLDSIVIGRALGVDNLGVYNRAMTLVAYPMGMIITSMQSVLFASCSRAQHDMQKVKKAYLGATAIIAYICLPLFVTIAVVPDTVVMGLYGSKWSAAVPLISPLALAMFVNALLALIGPVLMAMDKVGLELRTQLLSILFMLPVLYFTSQYSISLVAWGVLVVYIFRWLLLVIAISKVLNIHWRDLFQIHLWPGIFAFFIALPTWGIDHLLFGTTDWIRLLIVISTAAISTLVLSRLFGPQMLHGPHASILMSSGTIPGFVLRWLRSEGVK